MRGLRRCCLSAVSWPRGARRLALRWLSVERGFGRWRYGVAMMLVMLLLLLSWYIVCCMYAVGVVICAVLGAIQVSGAYPNLEGSWLIFAPFGPCLGYAFTRHLSQRATQKKLAAGLKKTQ